MKNSQTCGTCDACRLLPNPMKAGELGWACRRHPPMPMLVPRGIVGGVAQVELVPVWPPADPKDATFFCLDWVPKPKDVH